MAPRKEIPTQNDFESLIALEKEVLRLKKQLERERVEHKESIKALKATHMHKLKERAQRTSTKIRRLSPKKNTVLIHDKRRVHNIRRLVSQETGVPSSFLYPTTSNTKVEYGTAKTIFNYLVLTYVGVTLTYTKELLEYKDHTFLVDVQDKIEHWIKHPKQYQKENEILNKCKNTIRSVRSRLVTMAM